MSSSNTYILFTPVALITAIILSACQFNSAPPSIITLDASSPLTCNILTEPKTIEAETVTYSCNAPGAYITDIDLDSMTASYITTNTQGTQITYGPVDMPILEVTP